MSYPRDIIFGQKGTKSPLLHQRLDVKRVSLKAVILLPTDPRGTHFWLPIAPGNATGNQLVTRSFTGHLLSEEIQKSPLPELPLWANFLCQICPLCLASLLSRLTLIDA